MAPDDPRPPTPRRRARLTRLRRWAHVVIVPFAVAAAVAPNEPEVVLAVSAAVALVLALWLDRFAGDRVRAALQESRALRFVDLALWNAALVVALLEPTLLVASKVSTNPLLTPPNAKSNERIAAYRFAPGAPYLTGHVNSRGFHDTDWAVPKPPGVFRIVALGDSFNFGIVPYEQNVLTLVEQELTRRCGARVEVANLGVTSLAPIDYLYLLNDEGRALEPDLVLTCVFAGNDIGVVRSGSPIRPGNWLTFALMKRLVRMGVESHRRSEAPDPTRTVGYVMSPERFLEHVVQEFLPPLLSPPPASIERRWVSTLEVLDRIGRMAGDGRFAVAVYPSEPQLDRDLLARACAKGEVDPKEVDPTAPGRRIAEHFAPAGVPVCDLLPSFEARRAEGRAYEESETHWNEHGNRIAANALADWLEPLVRARLGR